MIKTTEEKKCKHLRIATGLSNSAWCLDCKRYIPYKEFKESLNFVEEKQIPLSELETLRDELKESLWDILPLEMWINIEEEINKHFNKRIGEK